ncbi:MAG: hypothetical protein HZB46_02620 [Solirubrobacterales bacterium]|nr:hypothetical protein [Solirubrobacterales bacterium]
MGAVLLITSTPGAVMNVQASHITHAPTRTAWVAALAAVGVAIGVAGTVAIVVTDDDPSSTTGPAPAKVTPETRVLDGSPLLRGTAGTIGQGKVSVPAARRGLDGSPLLRDTQPRQLRRVAPASSAVAPQLRTAPARGGFHDPPVVRSVAPAGTGNAPYVYSSAPAGKRGPLEQPRTTLPGGFGNQP